MLAKRLLDALGAAGGLLACFPAFLAVAVVIKLSSRGPVFFRQERPGLGGKPFRIVKFRTLSDQRSPDGALLPDAKRMTWWGRFLRRWSLDELPELWNVLKGEMSLVGPRPLLMAYLGRYTPEQARRHEVRPGLTGWAQVNGRNALSWEDKFRLDVWYVDHRSLWLDIKILVLTMAKVVKGEGISATEHATMPEFTGRETGSEQVSKKRGGSQ